MTDDRQAEWGDDRPPYAPGEAGDGGSPVPERPAMPPRPDAVPTAHRGGDGFIVFFTIVALVILTLLVMACSGGNPAVLVLLFLFAFFIGFHYLLWGWWLGRRIRREPKSRVKH